MSPQEKYEKLLDWFNVKVDQACKVKRHDASIYRVAVQRNREAKPTTHQEVEQRAAGMVNVLAEWTEMMFPREKSRAEIQEILFGVVAE